MNKNDASLNCIIKLFLTLIAIPTGFMLALCDIAKKQR